MIYLYSGTPGSGKSLHVARDIYNSLRYAKRPVISNFDINRDTRGYAERFRYVPNDVLTPGYLYAYASDFWRSRPVREDAILLVIDEAQLVFNSRAWQQRQRMDWLEFFSQHRHFGYKVIFVAQYDRMLDRQIRCLIEIETKHRRLANYGLKGKILSLPFGGKLFASIDYYYGLNEKVGASWFFPRRRYLRLYDSYNRFKQVE